MHCRLAVARALILASMVPAHGQDARVHRLAPNVYVWQGNREKREPANTTWVIFNDYILVVDANFPWGAREILPLIRRTSDKPIRFVFDTHYHNDHSFGTSLFVDAGATFICSEGCAEALRAKGASRWTNWHEAGYPLDGARLVQPGITFSDQLAFDDGSERVELIHVGPGHSKGDAVAYLPKHKILATGDLCVTWPHGNNVNDTDVDYDNWLRVLDRLAGWDVQTVIPGHGPLAGVAALRVQRDYLADMLNRVRAGREAGKSGDQLSREIDLSSHGTIAADSDANALSIRNMVQHLAAGTRPR